MNWIDIAWPMMAAATLTLALIHLLVWAKQGGRTDHLMFAAICISVCAISVFEYKMMYADTPEQFGRLMRWAHVPIMLTFIGLVGFVRLHFHVGNLALGALAIGARLVTLVADFTTGANLNYRSVTSLTQLRIWGSSGDTVAVPVGLHNPWMALGSLSVLLMIVFLISAIREANRRLPIEERRRVFAVCGSIILFGAFIGAWTLAVVHGVILAPFIVIPGFIGVLLVMSYDLGGAILRAAELARNLDLSQSQLHASERRMDLAVRAAGIGIWTWDIGSGDAWQSPTARRVLGFAPHEAIGREALRDRLHPADRDKLRNAYEAAVRGNGEFSSEFRITSADGATHWISARGHLEFAADGAPLRLGGVVLDVTERREAEERFRLVIEAAATAMLMVDTGGNIKLANRQAEVVFGYSRAELLTMHVDALVPARHRSAHLHHRTGYGMQATMRAMGAGRELFARRKDGSEMAVEIGLNPIHIDTNLFVLASITDIGERKRMERESAMQRDELAHLSRVAMLSELSGSMAHELNQPLTAILSNAQAAQRFMMHSPPALDDVRESLADIVENDKRASEIIRRLRAMMRKDAPEHSQLEINEVVQDVLRLVRSDLINRNVEVAVELGSDLPAVNGDRVQLQQVLLNLVMNGSDAMVAIDARPRLVIRTQHVGDVVEVSVSDVGRGIPPEDLESIFSPFVTSKPAGMGLGLAVCTTILTAHCGRLWATNNPGGGATLHFSLPVSA